MIIMVNKNSLLGAQYVPPVGLEAYYMECMIKQAEQQMLEWISEQEPA